jgi:hypothetical protein
MTIARWRDVEYELVNFTRGPPPQWVLRDKTGDVLEMDIEHVEVKCERCGRWSAHAAPLPAAVSAVADLRWVCHDGGCYDIEVASGPSRGKGAGMHVFTIDHISETPVRVVESTYYYFAVVLPDASVPGHALVNITDPANINAVREHVVNVLNTMVAEDGTANVIASLQSADGLNIWPPP